MPARMPAWPAGKPALRFGSRGVAGFATGLVGLKGWGITTVGAAMPARMPAWAGSRRYGSVGGGCGLRGGSGLGRKGWGITTVGAAMPARMPAWPAGSRRYGRLEGVYGLRDRSGGRKGWGITTVGAAMPAGMPAWPAGKPALRFGSEGGCGLRDRSGGRKGWGITTVGAAMPARDASRRYGSVGGGLRASRPVWWSQGLGDYNGGSAYAGTDAGMAGWKPALRSVGRGLAGFEIRGLTHCQLRAIGWTTLASVRACTDPV